MIAFDGASHKPGSFCAAEAGMPLGSSANCVPPTTYVAPPDFVPGE